MATLTTDDDEENARLLAYPDRDGEASEETPLVGSRSKIIPSDDEDEDDEDDDENATKDQPRPWSWSSPLLSILKRNAATVTMTVLLLILFAGLLVSYILGIIAWDRPPCNTVKEGYGCHPQISHYWGQYSPYFSLEDQSELDSALPSNCNITFVQMLSRHGARFPTAKKSLAYAALVDKIHESVREYRGSYAFLKHYEYSLGANDLTQFGESQMVDAGIKFYDQYRHLARDVVPFVRASGSERVILSGELFNRGFHSVKSLDPQARKDQTAPVINLVIPEGAEWNNTLDAGTCPVFEDGPSGAAQTEFLRVFAPSIVEKLTANLPGVSLTLTEAAFFMDLCPFETVAQKEEAIPSSLSPFCTLFTEVEWQAYDYYQSLGKYYGYGGGNPLGSTQGVGYVNELIARITRSPVTDHTCVNHTLDSKPSTFPLDAVLYADFTHDNAMTSIFDAFGLYNGTETLSTSQVQSAAGEDADGYSSSWTVPFAARAYFEVQKCAAADGQEEEFVRVLVNDRVVPLHGCQVDGLGRCKKEEWIDGLEFARNGGHWGACHNPSSS